MRPTRVAILIDGPNFKNATEDLGIRVNFRKFLDCLSDQGHILSILKIYFDDNPHHPKVENKFRSLMDDLGFELVSVKLKTYGINGQKDGKRYKSMTDNYIIVDIMEHLLFDEFDTIFLFSGDSDYRRVLEKVKEYGKQIVVVSSRGNLSAELKDIAEFVLIEELEKFIFPSTPSRLSA